MTNHDSNIVKEEQLFGDTQAVYFSGNTFDDIEKQYEDFVQNFDATEKFSEQVASNNYSVEKDLNERLSICAFSIEDVQLKWNEIKTIGLDKTKELNAKGIYYKSGKINEKHKVAIMFSGQASQYPNMLLGLKEKYNPVCDIYKRADTLWKQMYNERVTSLIFGEDEDQISLNLSDTKNTHPSVFISDLAMYRLLFDSGVKADYFIGHSLGEIAAICAAGAIDFWDAMQLVGIRGYSFDEIPHNDRGKMLLVKAHKDKVQEWIDSSSIDVSIANINSKEQVVVGGDENSIDAFKKYLGAIKEKSMILNVSHAFHTKLTKKASEKFLHGISKLSFKKFDTKVIANHMGRFYGDAENDLKNMPNLLKDQIEMPVNFVDSVLKLYDLGVRFFIESGPGNVLTNLVKNILDDKDDVKILTTNVPKKNAVVMYKHFLAEAFVWGLDACDVEH